MGKPPVVFAAFGVVCNSDPPPNPRLRQGLGPPHAAESESRKAISLFLKSGRFEPKSFAFVQSEHKVHVLHGLS